MDNNQRVSRERESGRESKETASETTLRERLTANSANIKGSLESLNTANTVDSEVFSGRSSRLKETYVKGLAAFGAHAKNLDDLKWAIRARLTLYQGELKKNKELGLAFLVVAQSKAK